MSIMPTLPTLPTAASAGAFRLPGDARAKASRAMPRFRWSARDRAGQTASGELHAATLADARAALRVRGLSAIRVSSCPAPRGRRIAASDTARFTRQLATLLNAGIPLPQSLDLIAGGHANARFVRLLSTVRDDIATGSRLAQALSAHPQVFDALYCNLIDAGEAGGVLPQQLERLGRQKESSVALRARLRAALRYPAVLLAVGVAVVGVLASAVIPAFKDVFDSIATSGTEAEVTLPAATRLLIAGSDAIAAYWPVLLAATLVTAAVGRHALRHSERAQRLRDDLALRLPVLGTLLRKTVTARWARTLSTLLEAGIPLLDAMEATAHAAGNWRYRDATRGAAGAISGGAGLSESLRGCRLFDDMLLQMVQTGEQAGALGTMLERLADARERDVDEAVASLSALFEPLMIVALGVLIGGIVVAMYLPIFRLAQAV